MNKILIVADQQYIRDAQLARHPDADPMDAGDDWMDVEGGVIVRQCETDDPKALLTQTAELYGLPTSMFRVYRATELEDIA